MHTVTFSATQHCILLKGQQLGSRCRFYHFTEVPSSSFFFTLSYKLHLELHIESIRILLYYLIHLELQVNSTKKRKQDIFIICKQFSFMY
jgi:hypothetical protein